MAVNSFEDVLAGIQEPEFKETLEKAAEKYPDLKAGWMRQDDYSRKSNERDSKVKLAEQWNDWRKNNWDEDLGMTKAEIAAQQRIKEIEAEAETLRQARETNEMTFEEVQREIQKEMDQRAKGFLTEDTFKQKYGGQLFNKADYDKSVDERVGRIAAGLESLYTQTYPLGFKHKEEFGEILDPVSVVEYANKNGYQDLSKAYDSMVSGRRSEVQKKQIETQLAEAEKRGEQKAKQEMAMGTQGRMPTDGGAPEMSHLQQKILRGNNVEVKDGVPEEVKMDGSGRLGHHVAEQYRKDQAAQVA